MHQWYFVRSFFLHLRITTRKNDREKGSNDPQACIKRSREILLTIIPIGFGKTWCAWRIIRVVRMIIRYRECHWRTFATTRFDNHRGFFSFSPCVRQSIQRWWVFICSERIWVKKRIFEEKTVDRENTLGEWRSTSPSRDRSEEQVTGERGGKRRTWLLIDTKYLGETHTHARGIDVLLLFQQHRCLLREGTEKCRNLSIRLFLNWMKNKLLHDVHLSLHFFSRSLSLSLWQRTVERGKRVSINWHSFLERKDENKQLHTGWHRFCTPSIGKRWYIRSPSFRKKPPVFVRALLLLHMLIRTGRGRRSSSERRKERRHKALSGKTSLLFYSITALTAINIISWEDAGGDRLERLSCFVFSSGRKSTLSLFRASVCWWEGMLVRKEYQWGCSRMWRSADTRMKERFCHKSDQKTARDAEKNTNLSRSMQHLALDLARSKYHFSLRNDLSDNHQSCFSRYLLCCY